MNEASVEQAFVKYVRERGGLTIKLQTQGARGSSGWPDRMVFLLGGRVYFVEVKAPGRKNEVTELQARRHEQLRQMGHHVSVHDNAFEARAEFDKLWEGA